jgi:transposase
MQEIAKLGWHAIFNYILRLLYLGCQWKELPIEKDRQGRPEIHYTRIYRAFRRWQADGCFDAIFEGSVFCTIERLFAWEDKFRRLLLRFERLSQLHYAFKTLAYTMINLRHYCRG